ncbi:DUF3923 family protein [Lactobacillus xylocopicola]|uniref:DUF3923 family protein n=1 Tax=Lactobacillus xylocopicola TaxID=2976676 RepID=A0ABN6SL87_9LACO|nr:DUF3923 family protein [Lactobacillus xylocopicola]BDR59776.1 hypothetical protein KIM322_00370 [Lactobacillus xylocopicola]
MKQNRWQIVNAVMVIIFAILALVIWFRKYDGSGAVNTIGVKLSSLAVLGIFLLLVLVVELVVYWLTKK